MKKWLVIFFTFFCTVHVEAQNEGVLADSSLVGIWKGKIITTDKHLPYEIVISKKDGKLTGYTYTTYTVNAREMVAVRSISVRVDKGQIITEDDDLLFDSFDKSSAKQIKQTNTLTAGVNGELLTLSGKFETKKTKNFRSLSGEISLQKEKEPKEAMLMAKLEELNLTSTLSFAKPADEERILEKKSIPVTKIPASPRKSGLFYVARPALKRIPVADVIIPETIAKAEPKPTPPPKPAAVVKVAAPVPVTKKPATATVKETKPVAAVPTTVKPAPVAAAKPVPPKPSTTANAPSFTSALAKREIETIQTVHFKTDSLLLTLYDNGTVDGDTVSIVLDGKMILPKQGLSTNAVNKTIYLPQEAGDSMQLVMYAENLGSLPPNTGLLIIRDGTDRYEIRFAGDLEKNAAIILKRRKL